MRLRTLSAAGALTLGLSVGAFGLPGLALAGSDTLDRGAVSLTKQVSRIHLDADGTERTVDTRTVTLHVAQTRALHSRQPVVVSWSGARPTAGVASDPNSAEARQQEYPFMLVECRGVDSASAPDAQRMTPETCWTGSERERVLQDRSTGFGPWRLDRYETPANRKAVVGVPDPLPSSCSKSYAKGERWLHFVSVKHVDYASNGSSCLPSPPEVTVVGNTNQPPNTSYAATSRNGTGSTKFTVWTSEDNASMGCGGGTPCALVAIPVMGVSCDVAAKDLPAADRPSGRQATTAEAACEATGQYAPGAPGIGGTPDLAVSGAAWFSESNWRNRITVPLDFAPLNNVCDITATKAGVDVYGSELLAQLTSQWRPAFCLSTTLTPFKHVQVGEPQAANLLKAGNVSGAFVTDGPDGGYDRPVVTAPVALTGFAISYAIDDGDQHRFGKLKLTARLVAKLLTESYPGINPVKTEDEALSRNPLDISQDPEFIALNPGIRHGVPDSAAASTLLNLSSDSDVVRAMTSWINADPDATEWLHGVPDPWGMTVNPNYNTNPRRKTGFSLPVANWPLRDAFEPTKYYASGVNICLNANPVPILPLLAAPTARLANISLAVQFANSSATIVCNSIQDKGADGAKLVPEGRQSPGYRFVLGLTSLGDAARYDLDTAALQTATAPDAADAFTDSKGRTFVSPDSVGLRAAAGLLTADTTAGTWRLPYDKLHTSTTAYPGTMLVSLAVPTKDLDRTAAKGLSQLLDYAAGTGQVPGLDVGQLPPGYLPLTSANGLGAQRAYTLRAATAVVQQKGATLPLIATAAPVPTAPTTPIGPRSGQAVPGTPGQDAGPFDGPAGTSVSGGSAGAPALPGPVAVGGPLLHGVVTPPGTPAVAPALAASGTTPGSTSALASTLFPLLAVLGTVGLLAAGVISRLGRPLAAP